MDIWIRAQYERNTMKSSETVVEQIFDILVAAQDSEYIGEPISQLEHALQCAKIASDAGGSEETVIAALLHDFGHLCAPPSANKMDEFGIDGHHRYGSETLKEMGFSQKVSDLVNGHVEAKRFLVAQHPKYLEQLSPASRETLKRQGGAMSDVEKQEFLVHPLHKEMLQLRVFDDQAKHPGWEVPTLDFYREIILAHLKKQAV
jgi:predicted HD phosphohydrolase